MVMVNAKKVILKDQDGNTLIPFVEGMGVHEIGEVFSAPYTEKFTPKGAVPANGKEYRAGGYNDFWNNFVITGLVATCTYEEFDRQVRENGFCDVYAVDTVNRNFKVPQIPDGLTLGVEPLAKVRGSGITLGLTNGLKNIGLKAYTANTNQIVAGTDAYGKPTGSIVGTDRLGFNDRQTMGITQDADKSGMVAEPKAKNATKQKWFCQLASGEINKADLDLNGLRADIANSANVNLSNISSDIDIWYTPVQTADGKWYQRSKSGQIIQWGFNASKNEIITFPKPFDSLEYGMSMQWMIPDTDQYDYPLNAGKITTTSFQVVTRSGVVGTPICWKAWGKERL